MSTTHQTSNDHCGVCGGERPHAAPLKVEETLVNILLHTGRRACAVLGVEPVCEVFTKEEERRGGGKFKLD